MFAIKKLFFKKTFWLLLIFGSFCFMDNILATTTTANYPVTYKAGFGDSVTCTVTPPAVGTTHFVFPTQPTIHTTFSITCDNATVYVGLGCGLYCGIWGVRAMGTTVWAVYDLYSDAAMTTIWGDRDISNTYNHPDVQRTINGTSTFDIWGQLTGGTPTGTGSSSDTVTIEVGL